MPRISEEEIEAVRHQADIVDVIGHYLQVHKKGKSYVALCPFHAPYTYEEILCGPLLIQDKPSEFVRFCRHSAAQLSDVVSRRGRIDQKQGELKKRIAVYRRYAEEKN